MSNFLSISQQFEADVLIVGGGIGGLACCVEAHAHGIRPLLISKSPLAGGASYFPLKATLGIQVTGGEADFANFKADIDRVAQGMNNPKIVQAYIEDSAQGIELLEKIGFRPWQRQDNRPACFAQFPRPIFLINDWKNAAKRARQIIDAQQTPYFEHATLLNIVVRDNQVQGAIFSQHTSGHIRYFFCKTSQIVLASGGIAGLYQDNLYPADVIGSTHFVAQQAGARLTNLEFIQFIPAFVEPKYKVLFGEHTLKYVEKVTDAKGNNLFPHLTSAQFQQMMFARSDYAPFSIDFACAEFDLVVMRHLLENPQAKGVYLHYSPALYQDQTEFYRVYLDWLKQQVGIDLCQQPIAIAPFAHSCNGGVVIDEFAESEVKGLFAVGEIASCIEGANRLGGNSVGGSLVFAKRAVRRILQNLAEKRPLVSQDVFDSTPLFNQFVNELANPTGDPTLTASQLLSEIRQQMSTFANVYRTPDNLSQLQQRLLALEARYQPLTHHQHHGIEIYNALKTAQQVVAAMQSRAQSLGAHFMARS